MKTHQSIIGVTLLGVLLLTSACGKKSILGVSGTEDLSGQGNNEVADYVDDKEFSDDLLAQFGESTSGDGGTVEALSTADFDKDEGVLVAGGPGGASSRFSASKGSEGLDPGASGVGNGFGMRNSKGGSRTLSGDQYAASGSSSGTAGRHENAWRNGARVSHNLRDVFFDYDSWRLSEQSHRILEANAKWLKAHPHARVTIEGHCDERGTRAYNYVLGKRRAEMTRQYLADRGVPANQMMVVSFGKDQPICRVFNASCFRANRRAHFSMEVNMASRD